MACVSFAGSSSQPSLCTWPQEVGSKTAKGVRYARLATSRDALAHTAWGRAPSSPTLAGWQGTADGALVYVHCEESDSVRAGPVDTTSTTIQILAFPRRATPTNGLDLSAHR